MAPSSLLLLDRDGAQRFEAALTADELKELSVALKAVDHGQPVHRISEIGSISRWAGAKGPVGRIAAAMLGPGAMPVRAILFDKNPAINWALGWHQDRTIAVGLKADIPGFGPWTVKDGVAHVEPPFALIERMVTLRVHLDRVALDNAPLRISPGTHRVGKIPEPHLAQVVEQHGVSHCLAEAGDVWAYRTAIIHASERSAGKSRRRVLQVDYSADRLPEPLRWQLSG